MQDSDFVGFEFSRLKMHMNEWQDCLLLHFEALIQVVEYLLEGKQNVNWLPIEVVVQILLCEHHLCSILVWPCMKYRDLERLICGREFLYLL